MSACIRWPRKLTYLSLIATPITGLQWQAPTTPLAASPPPPLTARRASNRGVSIRSNDFSSQTIPTGMRHQRAYRYRLFSSRATDAGENDGFDQFMEELSDFSSVAESVDKTLNSTASETITSSNDGGGDKLGGGSPHFIQGENAVGIGGNDGFVYDVNALKRNLVQESVRGCKKELLVLLGDGSEDQGITTKSAEDGKRRIVAPPRWRRDRDDMIEERLSALVQANPVSTTTDSNLLDGEWSFAFATHSASTILDTSRFLLSKTKRTDQSANNSNEKQLNRGGPWSFRAGKTDNPFRSSRREIYLENLTGDENAHIIDETRILGGVYRTSRRYDVYGLTRTAIDLDLIESESKLFGICVGSKDKADFKGTAEGQPLEIQVLYLDTDLCICTTGAGMDGPLHVYTKSESWVTGKAKRKLLLIAKTASWVSAMQSPLRIRQRLLNAFSRKRGSPGTPNGALKGVNIGELDIDEYGKTREDTAWDGPDDPFLHLSPGERMDVLRNMSLQDIYQSALERKMQNKKQKKKWLGNRGKKFKRPDS